MNAIYFLTGGLNWRNASSALTSADGVILILLPVYICLFSLTKDLLELIRGAVFPISFNASILHVNGELGCGLTEFLRT